MDIILALCSLLCFFLFFLCVLAAPITLIIWITLLIKKSEKKEKLCTSF